MGGLVQNTRRYEGIPSALCQMANTLKEPERAPELVITSLLGLAAVFVGHAEAQIVRREARLKPARRPALAPHLPCA